MRLVIFLRPFLVAGFLSLYSVAWGGQFLGGELSYRYISRNGNEFLYELTFKLYRECLNPADLDDPVIRIINSTDLTKNIHPVLYREEVLDNPVISNLPFSWKDYCSVNDPRDCYELRTYTRLVTLPYSPEGYTFYYTSCCRNGMTNLQNHSWNAGIEWINGAVPVPGQGLTYVTRMPSHDSIPQNSSPVSVNDSIIYACIDKPFNYRFRFYDPDGDSLVYKLATSLAKTDAANTYYDPIFFINGFTALHPMQGSPLISLDEATGVFSGSPDVTGHFTVAFFIEEYRDGKLIAQGRKDFQVNVTECNIQRPPDIFNCSDNIAQFSNANNPANIFHWDFGVPLINDDTSNIPVPIYQYPQSGTFSVKLVIINPAGCADSVFSTANVYPGSLQLNFDWTGEQCAGEPLTFTDRTAFPLGVIQKWTWKILNNNTIISTEASVTYTHLVSGTMPYPLAVQLSVESDLGCRDVLVKDILIYDNVKADAGPDRILAFGQVYQMQGNSSATGVSYNWSPSFGLSDPFIRHPELRADRDIEYTLTVSNEAGCVDSDKVAFRYMKGPDIYVATGFTPNGDGVNDVLHFFPVAMEKATLTIYNRWGATVFSSSDITKGWDGKLRGLLQDTGIFVWMVKATDLNGEPIMKKGTVLLIR